MRVGLLRALDKHERHEHPNHGCVTQALMDALTAFFHTDEIPYSVTSTVTNTTHSFLSFEDVVEEVDDARIFGGIRCMTQRPDTPPLATESESTSRPTVTSKPSASQASTYLASRAACAMRAATTFGFDT